MAELKGVQDEAINRVVISPILKNNVKPIIEIQHPLEDSKSVNQYEVQHDLNQIKEIVIASPLIESKPERLEAKQPLPEEIEMGQPPVV